jgi:hypothetical protein
VFDRRLEHGIAAGVIAVMVGVDQQLDALWRLLLQTIDARARGRGKLAVHRNGAVAVDQVPDRAALAGEIAHPPPQFVERRDGRRGRLPALSERLVRRSAERGGGSQSKGSGRETGRREEEELTTIHVRGSSTEVDAGDLIAIARR